jgi:hypothetical protein
MFRGSGRRWPCDSSPRSDDPDRASRNLLVERLISQGSIEEALLCLLCRALCQTVAARPQAR